MMEQTAAALDEPESRSTTHIVHVLMQFAVAVRHRKGVIIGCVLACGLLGVLYYVLATPYYSSVATLLVLQSGSETNSTRIEVQSNGATQGLMPTFENLISQEQVIETAIQHLRPEDRIDLADVPRAKWVERLRRNLKASIDYGTNFINIEYHSKDPDAAVSVVNALVKSYLDYLDKIHYGTAKDILAGLEQQQQRIAQERSQTEWELNQARAAAGDFVGLKADSTVVHPDIEHAISLNKDVIEAASQRAQLEELVANRQRLSSGGDDWWQAVLADPSQLAGNVALYTVGANDRDATWLASLVRELLEDQAELESMMPYLGPSHPLRIDVENRIRAKMTHLRGYWPQKLADAQQRESALRQQYSLATQKAIDLNIPMTKINSLETKITWLDSRYDGILDRITNIGMDQEGPSIRAEVTDEPVRALKPISPNLRRVGMMALVAGLGLGLAAVYVLDVLDDRFRSVEEMQAQLRVPVMAIVRRLPISEKTGVQAIQIHADPDAPLSEAFRTLRTALSLTEGPSRQIVLTSSEPGDGKTTVLLNLAAAFAQSGKKTLVIDADLRRPGLTASLNLRGVQGLSSVVRSDADLVAATTAYIRLSGIDGLDVLPAGPRLANPAELLGHPRFSELLAWAESVYDQVLIDSPPVLAASDAVVIGRLVDGAVLVVDPAKNQRRLVLRAAETLSQLKISLLGVVVNRIGAGGEGSYYEYGADYESDYGYEDEDNEDWEDASRAA